MPDYNTSDDPYGDAAGVEAPPESEPNPEKETGQTALLPTSICPGMSPGDELVMTIVRVHDDQYEVEYSPEPEGEEIAEAEIPQGGEMSGMME
jgi:hypothetical protein